jgi:hypothetical protein
MKTVGKTLKNDFTLEQIQRFMSNIEKKDGCMVWTGYKHPASGKPFFTLAHGQNYGYYAIRFAWALAHGTLDAGISLVRDPLLCRYESCVDPAHYRPMTILEQRARARRKLSDGVVAEIRVRYSPKWNKLKPKERSAIVKALSQRFEVSRSVILDVILMRRYNT